VRDGDDRDLFGKLAIVDGVGKARNEQATGTVDVHGPAMRRGGDAFDTGVDRH